VGNIFKKNVFLKYWWIWNRHKWGCQAENYNFCK